ncbi:MAG: hypothetical protein N2053_00335 [Chitinispirillaceae bacterium]|nr:hypothetical protein [Chitinispirillaceae bacterium]
MSGEGKTIGQSLLGFQAALKQSGESFESFIRKTYSDKWRDDTIYHVMAIRTTLVNSMQEFLANYGLLNMERVLLSPVTDPLAHDVEQVPSISYKGHIYRGTHSMIYSKFLACFNKKIKGIYVDSPNIRLELESATGEQRGKYLIDFSQMDIEVRRERNISLEEYYNEKPKVIALLKEDYERAISFFEDLVCYSVKKIIEKNDEDLKYLGVALEEPKKPFPRYRKDEAEKKFGRSNYEKKLGEQTKRQFFWVTGLLRENYDLIYPYLNADGTKKKLSEFTSDMIYNYDICAQALDRDTNKFGTAYEICSGAIREWLYEPIIERLIDNNIIKVRPIIVDGNIENIEELEGYGPFLMAAYLKDEKGKPLFPETFGGGIGIERMLFALCKGKKVSKVDDVTLFGKNPDSHPLYLF